MAEQTAKQKSDKQKKKPVWPGGVSPKAAGCGYLELVQPIYDKFQEEAAKKQDGVRDEKTAKPSSEEPAKKKKDDLPSPKAMGCGYLTLPDRPRPPRR